MATNVSTRTFALVHCSWPLSTRVAVSSNHFYQFTEMLTQKGIYIFSEFQRAKLQ